MSPARYPSSFMFKDGVPDAFQPKAHIFYSERVMELNDGVPKWSGHMDNSELLPHESEDTGRMGLGKKGDSKKRKTDEE